MRALTRKRLRLDCARTAAVQTWCRLCGHPFLLEVVLDYEHAKRNFYALDDQPMVHKNVHAETSGWGIHLRLDDVLATLFPAEHKEECWPVPAWYGDRHSEDQAVNVVNAEDSVGVQRLVDVELRMLSRSINLRPRTREALEQEIGVVWDAAEVAERFEVLGFKSPFAVVRERATGQQGSLLFQNHPRFYWGFTPHGVI